MRRVAAHRHKEAVKTGLEEARREIMGPLSAASMESYSRAYPLLVKLHMLQVGPLQCSAACCLLHSPWNSHPWPARCTRDALQHVTPVQIPVHAPTYVQDLSDAVDVLSEESLRHEIRPSLGTCVLSGQAIELPRPGS